MSKRVVHCKRSRYDVYIGRPSIWGNPFVIGRDGTREEVIAKYRTWLLSQPQLVAKLPMLRGKVLGCWCTPKPCHGDVLVELSEAATDDEPRQCDRCHHYETECASQGVMAAFNVRPIQTYEEKQTDGSWRRIWLCWDCYNRIPDDLKA